VYRIDRHPIMSVHPVTPMDESDLTVHLGRQTGARFARVDLPSLDAGLEGARVALAHVLDAQPDAVLLDGATAAHRTRVGALLDEQARRTPGLFVVGPSGVEYALTQAWRAAGTLPAQAPDYPFPQPARRVLALSGSASALSATQIDAAIAGGFAPIEIDACALVDAQRGQDGVDALAEAVLARLRRGERVIAHTARGADDPRVRRTLDSLRAQGWSAERARHEGGRLLGQRLGEVVRRVLAATTLDRLLLSGGDTSSQVAKALAPDGMVVAARLARGAPLCRFVSADPRLDGLEVALKGGQMGEADFFVRASAGSDPRASQTPVQA
jgi:uncharacterized protein YgbK (DUF1537 family)